MRKADPRSWAFLRTPSQLSVSGIPSSTFLFFRREAPRLSFFLQCIRIPAFNESLSKGVRVEVGLRSGLLDSTDSSSRLVYSTPASVIHLVISFVSDDSAIRMNCWRNSTFKTGNPESDEILSFIHYNFFALIQKIGSNWLLNKAQETSWSTSHPLPLQPPRGLGSRDGWGKGEGYELTGLSLHRIKLAKAKKVFFFYLICLDQNPHLASPS